MGISLYLEGQCWGVLTLDSLAGGPLAPGLDSQLSDLARACEAVLRMGRLEEEVLALRLGHRSPDVPLAPVEGHEERELIGRSPVLLKLLHELDIVADSDLPVLLAFRLDVNEWQGQRKVQFLVEGAQV